MLGMVIMAARNSVECKHERNAIVRAIITTVSMIKIIDMHDIKLRGQATDE